MFETRSIEWAGESLAAAAGQEDGTEDAFFRAVRVVAWAHPAPPMPRPESEAPPETIRRVIGRRWHTTSTRTLGGGGNPAEDGALGAALGDLVKQIYNAATRGGSDTREYSAFPVDWVVVRVYDEYVIDDSLRTGPVSTMSTTRTIRYEWGPHTPTVVLWEKSTLIQYGGSRRVNGPTTQHYPRAEIWQRTTAPTAMVL